MTETTAVPVEAEVAPSVQKAVQEALGTLIEKVQSHEAYFQKAQQNQPKAWFTDPFALLDSLGMGYRAHPSMLTYDTLRIVSERDTVVAAIIATRVNQVAAFCRPQENKYSVGFVVRPRGKDKKRRLTASEKDRVEEITYFFLNTGRDYNLGRDSFEQFMRKLVRDRLTYDQATFEKVKTLGGQMHSFHAVPADTVRIAHPKIPKGTPPSIAETKRMTKYVQLINAQIVSEFTIDELAFMVANPRTHVKSYGYGFPEIEILMTTVTSHLWAEEWNRRAFSQGSTVKGVLNLKGNLPLQQFEAFKRQWTAQVAGVTNAWKTPVLNTDGIEWVPMQMNNQEMGYQMWMEYLIKVACAIFQIDPSEINFDLRGSSMQQPVFMSNNEAQQKVSKDRGLHPLLRFVEDHLNKHIVWQIDPRFEFAFVGLDAKTEEQAMQLRMQQVQNVYTLNEIRAMEDLLPINGGDIVLNPTYTGARAQDAMMQQQQQAMGGVGGGPPGAGGPPGGDAGGGAEPQGPDLQAQPYASRFGGQPYGDEEQEGAENIRQFDERADAKEKWSGTAHDEDSDSEESKRYMHLNDWDSSVHASVADNDLRKSIILYDTLDLG